MLISELILQLQKVQLENGDLTVLTLTDEPLDYFDTTVKVTNLARKESGVYDEIVTCDRFNERYTIEKVLVIL